jgi:manganese-dependent inorganic pyrophosphatase
MILEIIDHHRLSPLGTSEPVTIRIQPYGSTATIIYEIYKEKGLEPDRPTAGLLCAAVISDTRLFRSQDTTSPDRLSGAALANIAGLDIERFATEMFDILG